MGEGGTAQEECWREGGTEGWRVLSGMEGGRERGKGEEEGGREQGDGGEGENKEGREGRREQWQGGRKR